MRGKDFDVGARAHYDDPIFYDHSYDDRTADIAYYLKRAVDVGGPILELGAGSGRVTVPMLNAGLEVVALDHSKPMLQALRTRAGKAQLGANLTCVEGDLRSFDLGDRQFQLVIAPFNVVLHLYDAEEFGSFLRSVSKHLSPGAELVFDTSMPVPADLARNPEKPYKLRPFRHPTLGVKVKYQERFDYDPLTQVLHVLMEFEPAGLPPFVVPLTHRQWYPAELSSVIHFHGFETRLREGGFEGEPINGLTETIVWTVRPTNTRSRSSLLAIGGD